MTTEATIRAAHRAFQDGVVGGLGGMARCSCGARWFDADADCPSLEAALEAFAHARFDDDGGSAR